MVAADFRTVIVMRRMDVVPYDENWTLLFEQEKEILQNIFGDKIIQIEHFGSTSVKGLSAKPIIDIMPLVQNIDEVDKFNEKMRQAGYDVRGEKGMPGRRYFVRFNSDNSGNHTHHIHFYQPDNQAAIDFLLFRDYIRVDEKARQEYGDLKLYLSKKFYKEPLAYTEGKTELVSKIMDKAKKYFEIKQISDSIAPCGLVCKLCHFADSCDGCKSDNNCCGLRKTAEGCYQYNCCEQKGIDGCWQCDIAPCDKGMFSDSHDVRLRAFITYIKQNGKDKLADRLYYNAQNGVHYGHGKDYDNLDSINAVIERIEG